MVAERFRPTPPPGLNPGALSLADAARLLARASGWPITEAMLRADLAAGAPTNADGTINLVHYAAWLVRQAADRRREGGIED
ncbi:MAG: hypothetical protein NZM33_17370 [Bryobacteraceae bacterium]|nr:hypothetical protein [Bryobacteraceae bacterium]